MALTEDLIGTWAPRLSVRNAAGVAANFSAYDAEVQAAMRLLIRETLALGVETTRGFMLAHARPVYRTGKMYREVRGKTSPRGLAFEFGWFREDFLTDDAGRAIEFYPPLVDMLGTQTMPPRPSLLPAYEVVRPHFQNGVSIILREAARRRRAR